MTRGENAAVRAARLPAAVGLAVLATAAVAATAPPTEWTVWGGDPGQTHFSALTQITPQNVAQLKPVWIYNPGTTGRGWENTPLLVAGKLITSDPTGDIVALDPVTGDPIWRWKSPIRFSRVRGLSYWPGDGTMKPRILAMRQGRVIGLDVETGFPVQDWPNGSFNVSLPNADGSESTNGTNSSPGLVYKNMLIVANSGGGSRQSPGFGDPRAYDLRTGRLLWRTRLIPAANQPGGDSWGPGTQDVRGSGSWGILSIDERTGTVLIPTDSPGTNNYVGINRPGDNRWQNSHIALDAETGAIKWGFQISHHDLWDYDNMAAPAVTEITHNGQRKRVAVATTKVGTLWIYDIATGQPIHGWEERPVPQSTLPGERSSPTQPYPLKPPPLGRTGPITRNDLTKLSPESTAYCQAQWDRLNLQHAGHFTPPYPTGATLYLPGSSGAVSWGGNTINHDTGVSFVNVTNIPVYNRIVRNGENTPDGNNGYATADNFTRFADQKGRPCIDGRIGELMAINIASGDILWRVPLGTMEDDYGPAARPSGAPNIGPSLATRSGVLFIGATADERFRAFDQKTGRVLWEHKLSAAGVAGPMTYIGRDGRQYVVIAAGGPGTAAYRTNPQWGYRQTLVAFAIPRPGERIPDIVTPYPKRMPVQGEVFQAQ